MRRVHPALPAVGGGLLLAAATPPWGFWPLAVPGLVLLERGLVGGPALARFSRSWLTWVALFVPSMFWMRALTLPGYVIACVLYGAFLALGTLLAPRGPGRLLAIPAGIVVAEWVRWRWPFGGVPLSNIAVGQVAGPLAPVLRLGGALLLVLVTAVVGMAAAALARRWWRGAAGLAAGAAAIVAVASIAPAGTGTGRQLEVAVLQGGGPQETRAADTEPGVVLERHLEATRQVQDGVDLLLWPEDVVDVSTLAGSPTEAVLAEQARRLGTTFVAGVIEDVGRDAFHNWAVVYGPDGVELDRYEKVERVPFGEWVPFRSLLERLAGDAGLPARDAMVGREPAVVETPHGRLGVSISWEIFFGERAREAARHGALLLLNPTNGSSFNGTQVQTQQVANSRMRAIETGRWVLQAAPTGFSAIVTPHGDVLQRTAVSERAVLHDTVELRTGRTLYTRVGDLPALAGAVVLLGAGWALELRARRRSDGPGALDRGGDDELLVGATGPAGSPVRARRG